MVEYILLIEGVERGVYETYPSARVAAGKWFARGYENIEIIPISF